MLFGRKRPASWREKFRIAIWPRRSWARSAKYVAKRVLRLTASPHAVAAGVAAGVVSSFTPFLGFHFLIAFAIAYLIAGNFIAAAMGTFFGNPVTFPFIWASTFSLGRFILSGAGHHGTGENGSGHHRIGEIARADFFELGYRGVLDKLAAVWDPLIKPMFVGSIPMGIAAGIVAYIITRWLAVAFRNARARRMAARAARAAAAPVIANDKNKELPAEAAMTDEDSGENAGLRGETAPEDSRKAVAG